MLLTEVWDFKDILAPQLRKWKPKYDKYVEKICEWNKTKSSPKLKHFCMHLNLPSVLRGQFLWAETGLDMTDIQDYNLTERFMGTKRKNFHINIKFPRKSIWKNSRDRTNVTFNQWLTIWYWSPGHWRWRVSPTSCLAFA